jgi:hypothetical protein
MPKNELTGQLTFKQETNMNTLNYQPATQLETNASTGSQRRNFSAACSTVLDNLKSKLVARLTAEFSDLQEHLVHQAVDEADALASLTVVPHLLLPVLAEEKVQAAREWSLHQQLILQRSGLALVA